MAKLIFAGCLLILVGLGVGCVAYSAVPAWSPGKQTIRGRVIKKYQEDGEYYVVIERGDGRTSTASVPVNVYYTATPYVWRYVTCDKSPY